MTYETILCELRNGIMLITLNRPERLNAWTYQMGRELHHAIEAGNQDEAVLAMVLTGSGRGFCAGADIVDLFKAQSEGDRNEATETERPGNWVELVRGSKPMVAAVNGAAIGVGLRYGHGTLYLSDGSTSKVYWRGPSLGIDLGGSAAKAFVLIYDLGTVDDLYQRFNGVEGSLYFVGGVGVNYNQVGGIVLAPVRFGVGWRAGVNIGYLHLSPERSWLPF